MLNRSESSDVRRQQLSSLMDGALSPTELADACAQWRGDSASRADWHAYHLIGDVLRSDDLALPPARDEAFLQSLRLRLADEPVPLAPAATATAVVPAQLVANGQPASQPLATGARRPRHWLMAPVAVAAGFVAVAGVMVVTRVMAPEPAGPTLASASPAPAASAVLVRNAQLDRYLSAHRSLASGAVAGAGTEHRVYIVFEGQ